MERAINEVGKGYNTLKQLQGLLQSKPRADFMHTRELAEPLFREALQALNQALRIMNSGVIGNCKAEVKSEVKSEVAVLESGSPAESVVSYDGYNQQQQAVDGRGKRRSAGEHSWSDHTTMPYDDGYQWRKYGDKKINGTNFSRAYFRCTYKEEGCEAKKVVQQITNTDPHMFKVTYTNTHICNKFHKPTLPPPPSYNPYQSPFHAIDQMFVPELVCVDNSCSSDTVVIREDFAGGSMDESIISCDWDGDFDSLLRDLEFASGYIPLI